MKDVLVPQSVQPGGQMVAKEAIVKDPQVYPLQMCFYIFLKIFLQFLQTKSDSAVGGRLLELPILSINVVA